MSSYGPDANITGKLTKPSEQWFWWYNNPANAPTFQAEGVVPLNLWTLVPAATTGTSVSPATTILSSIDNTATGGSVVTFPVKGKYTISFSAPLTNTATNPQMWWTINTGYGITGNTTLWQNSLGWASTPSGLAGYCTYSGFFNAGDKVYPTVFSNASTAMGYNTTNRFSLSIVLDYRCT